jgi:hypothetical protein
MCEFMHINLNRTILISPFDEKNDTEISLLLGKMRKITQRFLCPWERKGAGVSVYKSTKKRQILETSSFIFNKGKDLIPTGCNLGLCTAASICHSDFSTMRCELAFRTQLLLFSPPFISCLPLSSLSRVSLSLFSLVLRRFAHNRSVEGGGGGGSHPARHAAADTRRGMRRRRWPPGEGMRRRPPRRPRRRPPARAYATAPPAEASSRAVAPPVEGTRTSRSVESGT